MSNPFNVGDSVRITNQYSQFNNCKATIAELLDDYYAYVYIGNSSGDKTKYLFDVSFLKLSEKAETITPTIEDIPLNHSLIAAKRVEFETETLGNVILNLANRGEITADAQEYLTELVESLSGKVTELLDTLTNPRTV